MPFDSKNRRRHERHLFFTNIEYCLNTLLPGEMFLGSNINMSNSGMCMYTSLRLREGDDIRISNDLPIPHQKATVRWTKRYAEDFYKVGLEFVADSSGPSAGGMRRNEYN